MSFKSFLPTILVLLATTLVLETKVQAQSYEEVSYDDLINQINKKRARASLDQASILDDITLHAGIGLITSTFNLENNNRSTQMNLNGFQLSFGIDLFSPYFVAESDIRNFGSSTYGDQNHSFREIDLKVFYRSPSYENTLGYRLGGGLGTQYLFFADSRGSIEESSPAMILMAGVEAKIIKNAGISAEVGYRSSLLDTNADRNSWDLTIRLDTYF